MRWSLVAAVVLTQLAASPPTVLPPVATTRLTTSLDASAGHVFHVWRDTPAVNPDGTVNVFVEIPRGERRKYEFDMQRHTREIDRVMPDSLGGYPVNYGFVPQTISYDGDPFDALVLGAALPGGEVIRGMIVGLMQMEDEKGLDSKVVVSPAGPDGAAAHQLTGAERERIADYFRRYKVHEPGKFSRVPGWSEAERGREFVRVTHRFFFECRAHAGRECRVGGR